MASSVFGDPITTGTLKRLPDYESKNISRTDRARVACILRYAGDKATNARHFVENLRREWGAGAGAGVSTLGLLYNATGDTLELVSSRDFQGHLGRTPYPIYIANGQWGGFLHVNSETSGSFAAVVYRGKNEANNDCDWMLAWSNLPKGDSFVNQVYTEIREANHFDDATYKKYIFDLISGSGPATRDESNGCLSYMSTGGDTHAIFEAVMTLKNT